MAKKINFDKKVNRIGSDSIKFANLDKRYGSHDIIPMWVADMDFLSAKEIRKALKKRVKKGVFGYPYNDKSIYNSIYSWQERRYGWKIKKGSISLASGVVNSIAFLIQAFSKVGDNIIIQSPVYQPFARTIKENERKVSRNSLVLKNGKYEIDFKDFQKRAKDAKIFILCNPHNPTGKVFSKKELLKLAEICLKNNVLIISDEIHSDFLYDDKKHIPIALLSKHISKKTITLNAPSKSFNIAGLMTSYVICEDKKLEAIYKNYLKKFELMDNNIFGTLALKIAYKSCEEWMDETVEYLQKNRDFAINFIKNEIPLLKVIKPEATYLLWIDFRKIGLKPSELEKFLITKAKIGLNNGLIYGKEGSGFARLNFGTQRNILKIALENLKQSINDFIV